MNPRRTRLQADVFGAIEKTSALAPEKKGGGGGAMEGGADQVLDLMFPSVSNGYRRHCG